MVRFLGVGLIAAGLLSGCVTVNDATVKEMPTSYLCQFLDANTWMSTQSERSAIFKELKARGQDCILPSGTAKPAQ